MFEFRFKLSFLIVYGMYLNIYGRIRGMLIVEVRKNVFIDRIIRMDGCVFSCLDVDESGSVCVE